VAIDLKGTQEKLDRLRRNEEQMTPEQRKQYAKNLQNFKKQIAEECTEILRAFLLDGLQVLKGDEGGADAIKRRIAMITEKQSWKDRMLDARDILFRTYSLDEFLTAVCPMHDEIWYMAYGPYWVSKTQVDPETGEITNPVVDAIWGEKFYWNAEHNQWEGKEKLTWTIMLPPTQELLEKAYREEVERYEQRKTGSAGK